MNHFNRLPEFEGELKKLLRKYRSLEKDLSDLKQVIDKVPTGVGKNFVVIHRDEQVTIVKTRLACASLKDRTIRVIYAHHKNRLEFMFIEIYFKGGTANEDRERIKEYLKNCA